MKKYFKAYLFLLIISTIIIGLDQYTKYLVRENIEMWTGVWAPWDWIIPYARIIHIPNTGVAFGMFQDKSWLFTIFSSVIATIIIIYFPRVPAADWSLRLAMALQFSGAVGNLIDRLTVGHVTDFISIGNFAVFNVADSSITVGVIVLIIGVWIQERNEKRKQKENEFLLKDTNLNEFEIQK